MTANKNADRYRLTEEDILSCCDQGYELGFRTFVLQGGEDSYFTDDKICSLVDKIKNAHPDCAVTLSIGEKERASYKAYFEAGADRYLLRQETSDSEHYRFLHPNNLSMEHRQNCLRELKDIGYQYEAIGAYGDMPHRPELQVIVDKSEYSALMKFMEKTDPHAFITYENDPMYVLANYNAGPKPAKRWQAAGKELPWDLRAEEISYWDAARR